MLQYRCRCERPELQAEARADSATYEAEVDRILHCLSTSPATLFPKHSALDIGNARNVCLGRLENPRSSHLTETEVLAVLVRVVVT